MVEHPIKLVLTKSGIDLFTKEKRTDLEFASDPARRGGIMGPGFYLQAPSPCLSLSVFLSVGNFLCKLNPCNGKDVHWQLPLALGQLPNPAEELWVTPDIVLGLVLFGPS